MSPWKSVSGLTTAEKSKQFGPGRLTRFEGEGVNYTLMLIDQIHFHRLSGLLPRGGFVRCEWYLTISMISTRNTPGTATRRGWPQPTARGWHVSGLSRWRTRKGL